MFMALIWLSTAGQAVGNSGTSLLVDRVAPDRVLADSDSDGVADGQDLCPGTPAGTAVNAYGCPLEKMSCDYTTSSFSIISNGGSSGTGITTRYILASNTGTILQVATVPTFNGLSGTATYMALAVTYDGSVNNLTAGQQISAVSANCLDWSDALIIKACILNDKDRDGVPDDKDLCPGTPIGTPVNAYGCPYDVAGCDYTTSTVTLKATGGSIGTSVSTRYVLTSNTGTILQVATVPTFNGLSGTATYMALAVTYDGSVNNLTAGQQISAVSANCLDWSDALVFRVCVMPPATCDYQIGQFISLKSAGGSVGPGITTKYVLANTSGVIVQVSNQPLFSTTALMPGMYVAYAITYTDDGTVHNLSVNGSNTLQQITATCINVSSGVGLRLCEGCLPKCLPIVVQRRVR